MHLTNSTEIWSGKNLGCFLWELRVNAFPRTLTKSFEHRGPEHTAWRRYWRKNAGKKRGKKCGKNGDKMREVEWRGIRRWIDWATLVFNPAVSVSITQWQMKKKYFLKWDIHFQKLKGKFKNLSKELYNDEYNFGR